MVVITIAGVDRTKAVEYSSLKITQVITKEPDFCEFIVRKFGDRTYTPQVGDEAIVTQDGTKLFAGEIQKVNEVYDEMDYVSYRVQCTDYTRRMDARLIVQTYEDMTVGEIIQDIKDNYLPNDITINNVDADTPIGYIAFNYEYPSNALNQLAEIANADWYIDYDKDIHFFIQKSQAAAFNLSDDGGKYIYDSLIMRRDISQLRNVIFVRGGEFLGNTVTSEFLGDATRTTFYLPHKYSDLSLTVTGQEKSVGVDPIDDPSGFDAMYNFQEKFVRFREDKTPSASAAVRIGGQPNLPVIVKMKDPTSIATFTSRESLVVDKTIKSKEGARDRALAELYTYKATLSEAEFKTYETTLHSGDVIEVGSVIRGLSEDLIINKIEKRIFGVDASDGSVKFVHKVSLVTTKTFDHIAFLKALISRVNKDIVIDDNEILDEVESILEEMNLSEQITVSLIHNPITEEMTLSETVTSDGDYGEEYVAGLWTSGRDEDTPSSKKRQFVITGSPLA